MQYEIQVDSGKYSDNNYLNENRWSTYSLIINQIIKRRPLSVLEIGPGNHIVSDILKKMNISIKTLDFDKTLNPDFLCDITDYESYNKERFDCIIASQVFEHIEYQDYLKTIKNLRKNANSIILTLPYTSKHSFFIHLNMYLPLIKRVSFSFKFIYKKISHQFNGQHYWEIGKKHYAMRKIRKDILKSGWKIDNCFINPQNPYHYFFILK